MSFVEGMVIIVLILAVMITVMTIIQKTSHNGSIVISRNEESGKLIYSLELDGDPYDIKDMKYVSFKVVKQEETAN